MLSGLAPTARFHPRSKFQAVKKDHSGPPPISQRGTGVLFLPMMMVSGVSVMAVMVMRSRKGRAGNHHQQ
jgi:hypothetical protein